MAGKELELIFCTACKGEGVQHKSTLTCYHKGEYDCWETTCKTCNGSGRLWMTTRIEYEPYVTPEVDDERKERW